MIRGLSILAGSVLALGILGCGGAPIVGVTRVATPTSDVVRAHKAVLVRGEGERPEWQEEARRLVAAVARDLEGQPYFSAVIDGDAPGAAARSPEIEIVIRVVELKRVSAVERNNLGKSAGEVQLEARVGIRELAGKSSLGDAAFDAKGYEGPRGGTTEDAEVEVSQHIVRWVTGSPAPRE